MTDQASENIREVLVIGHPIAHSRSPLIHNSWIRSHEVRGIYRALDVPPETIPNFIDSLRTDANRLGCNVTIPHKLAVMPHLDHLTERARLIGAVNTIYKRDNQLWGDNTDSYGFTANLDQHDPNWTERPGDILILGAGGATRGLLHGLSQKTKKTIKLFNRTFETAEKMAADLSGPLGVQIEPMPLSDLATHLNQAALLINATSIGMHGERHPDLDLARLPKTALVTDIVYTPLITPLLQDARDRGLTIVDGLGMLLHQAVPGFEYWFGIRPTVTKELRNLVVADLSKP